MTVYYNEVDPFAATWLRELIKARAIAPGEVDERSIEDVRPHELRGFTQCHFFAGIGVWSYALLYAGWPDDRPVWTGSCPCQPFSAAGKGGGFADERHLWPAFFHLISECRPTVVFGEQVASKDAGPWIDLVQDDVEALGYAFGAVPFPSAGVGAPHIRDRLYWVGRALGTRLEGHAGYVDRATRRPLAIGPIAAAGDARGLADSDNAERRADGAGRNDSDRADTRRTQGAGHAEGCSQLVRLANAASSGRREECANGRGQPAGDRAQGRAAGSESSGHSVATGIPGPANGFWRAADWILCRDPDVPKWRPVEPGTFPLAHGAAARVGRLRGYGNAINAEAARTFIEAYLETLR